MSSLSFLLKSDLPYFPVTFIGADNSVTDLLSLLEQHHHSSIFFVVVKSQENLYSRENSLGILVGKNIYQYTDNLGDISSLKVKNLPLHPIFTLKKSELKNIFIILYKFLAYNVKYLVVIEDNNNILGVICQEHFQKFVEANSHFNYEEIKQLLKQFNISVNETVETKKTSEQSKIISSFSQQIQLNNKEDNTI